jgi:hypothetical protein
MGMALWTGLFYHEPALLSPFYQLYSDREPPIHHSVCDELEACMLYLPTEEELRKELAPRHERREVAPNVSDHAKTYFSERWSPWILWPVAV